MEEKRNVPKLRFPGFTDSWEQRRLGELVDVRSGKDYKHLKSGPIPVYGTGGLITYVDDALSKNEDAVGIGRKGTIDQPYKLYAPFWTVDTLFYAVPKAGSDIEFVLCCFQRINWKAKDESTGLPSLSKRAIDDTQLLAPRSGEQSRIGALFAKLDSLIALHQRKLDHVKELKKGLLQKMFPKEGANVPELRFPGFTDPWEQRRLGELCTFAKGRGYGKADICDSGIPLILYGRLYTQYQTRIEEVDTFAAEKDGALLSKGNEVIVPASGETAEDIAVASSVRSSGIIFGGDLNVLIPEDALDPDYVALGITYGSAHTDLAKRAQGKSVVHVHNTDIAMTELAYPCIDEQKAISAFVLKLDSLIALHQRELDHVKELKKGLLQQMFV